MIAFRIERSEGRHIYVFDEHSFEIVTQYRDIVDASTGDIVSRQMMSIAVDGESLPMMSRALIADALELGDVDRASQLIAEARRNL